MTEYDQPTESRPIARRTAAPLPSHERMETRMTRENRIARRAGVLYLIIIAAGIFAQMFVRNSLTVPGDAAATVANLQGSAQLFRAGIAADVVMILADVALAIAFFALFERVSRSLSLLAAVFRLTQAAILGVNLLNLFLALNLANGTNLFAALGAPGRDQLALLFLDAHAIGYSVALIFFALSLLVLGVLVLRSRYLPRLFAGLLAFAALGYLVDGFARILLPHYEQFAEVLGMVVFGPAVVGELAIAVWLLVRGVRVRPATTGGLADAAASA